MRELGEKIDERRIHGRSKKGEEDIIRRTWAMKRTEQEFERKVSRGERMGGVEQGKGKERGKRNI